MIDASAYLITKDGSQFEAYPLSFIVRLAAHAECQRFISYQLERYTSRRLLFSFIFADCLSLKDV